MGSIVTLVPPYPGEPDDYHIDIKVLRMLIERGTAASKRLAVDLEDRNYHPTSYRQARDIACKGEKLLEWLESMPSSN